MPIAGARWPRQTAMLMVVKAIERRRKPIPLRMIGASHYFAFSPGRTPSVDGSPIVSRR
jgi:hypothetical protein